MERERNKQLRHQFNLVGRREQDAQDTIAQLQQEMTTTKQKYEQKIRTLQAEKLDEQTQAEAVRL